MLLNISMKESINWLQKPEGNWVNYLKDVSVYGKEEQNSVYIGGFLRAFFKIT